MPGQRWAYDVRIVLLLASSLAEFDSRAFTTHLFAHLSLRDDQLIELSERAGSIRLTAVARADDAAQADELVAALTVANPTELASLSVDLGITLLWDPEVTIEVRAVFDSPPSPPRPPPAAPPAPPRPPSPAAPGDALDDTSNLGTGGGGGGGLGGGGIAAIVLTLGLIATLVGSAYVCKRKGWSYSFERRLQAASARRQRKPRPMLSHGADVVSVVEAPLPWEADARPAAIQGPSHAPSTSHQHIEMQEREHAGGGAFGGDGGGDDDRGYSPPTLDVTPQPTPQPTVVSATRQEPETPPDNPFMGDLSGRMSDGGGGGDSGGSSSVPLGGKRKKNRGMRGSGSSAALIGAASVVGIKKKQGCMVNPSQTAPPVVYNVDEDGVGALPPTQSFARGEQRFVEEDGSAQVVTL